MKSKIKRLVMWVKNWLHHRAYTYGEIINADGSRRCEARRRKGCREVEFVLWKAGEQGHKKPYWYEMGAGWELRFKPYT